MFVQYVRELTLQSLRSTPAPPKGGYPNELDINEVIYKLENDTGKVSI